MLHSPIIRGIMYGYYGSSHLYIRRRRCLGFTQTTSTGYLLACLVRLLRVVSGAATVPIRTTTIIICFTRQCAAVSSVNTRRNRLPAPPWRRRLGKIFFVLLFFPRENHREREKEKRYGRGRLGGGVDHDPYGYSHRRHTHIYI